MELRRYWQIIRRRWLLILIPAAVVLALGLAAYRPPSPVYNVGVRFIVGQEPAVEADLSDQERYYNWTASEYIVNGLNDWVRGNRFAALVSEELARQGYDVPAGAIMGSLAADNARSLLTISLTFSDAETLAAMMDAVATVLIERNGDALPQLGGDTAVLAQLDEPVITPISVGIGSQLDLPFRVILALGVGIGLALLVEYLDPTLRSREEAQELGLDILGEIPKN